MAEIKSKPNRVPGVVIDKDRPVDAQRLRIGAGVSAVTFQVKVGKVEVSENLLAQGVELMNGGKVYRENTVYVVNHSNVMVKIAEGDFLVTRTKAKPKEGKAA